MKVLQIWRGNICVYQKEKAQNRWLLPVCSERRLPELERLRPNHQGNWETVALDGCPTVCYVLTGRLIKNMNRRDVRFTSFFSILKDCIGEGPCKEFFHELWLRDHNIRAKARNIWEERHHRHAWAKNPYTTMSVREAAHLSI